MLVSFIVLFAFNIFLGILPLTINKKDQTNISFSVMSVSLSLWILFNYFVAQFNNPIFWAKATLLCSSTFSAALLTFFLSYPQKKVTINFKNAVLIYTLPILFFVLSFTSFIIKDIQGTHQIYGSGYLYFSLYIVIYIILGLVSALYGYKSYSQKDKNSLKLIAAGCGASIFFIAITNMILPILGYSNLIQFGPIFCCIFIAVTFFSVLKNEMLKKTISINKNSAIIFVTGASLLLFNILENIYFYTFENSRNSIIYTAGAVLYWFTIGTSFQRARVFTQQTVEKLFLKGQYDYKKALIKFTEELSECTDIDTLNATIHKNFEDEIEISNIDIFLPEGFTERKETASKLVLQDQKKFAIQEEGEKAESKLKTITREDLNVRTLSESDPVYQTLIERSHPIAFINEKDKDLITLFNNDKKHAIVPCFNTGHKLLCVLTLGEKMTQDPYSDDDIDLLTTLAAQIPPVLERIHQARVSAEMDVAQRIQVEILPKDPEIKGLDLSCYMSPADEVGGDYYDVYQMEKASWLVVGDVAGHGVGSGLVMFMVQSIMATLLQSQPDITPGELNYQANQILCKNFERLDEDRPMTLVTLQTTDSRTFSISGSHDNIYIYRNATQNIEAISVDHFPFGIGLTGELERDLFVEETFTIDTGDLLFLGTDGITEAFKDGDDKAEQYGEDRLTDIISKHHNKPVNDIRKALLDDLNAFSQGIYYDDVTFIIAKAV